MICYLQGQKWKCIRQSPGYHLLEVHFLGPATKHTLLVQHNLHGQILITFHLKVKIVIVRTTHSKNITLRRTLVNDSACQHKL